MLMARVVQTWMHRTDTIPLTPAHNLDLHPSNVVLSPPLSLRKMRWGASSTSSALKMPEDLTRNPYLLQMLSLLFVLLLTNFVCTL